MSLAVGLQAEAGVLDRVAGCAVTAREWGGGRPTHELSASVRRVQVVGLGGCHEQMECPFRLAALQQDLALVVGLQEVRRR